MRRPAGHRLALALTLTAVTVMAVAVAWRFMSRPSRDESARGRIASLVESEELLLALSPRLKSLARGAKNLRLPSGSSVELFAETVAVRDLSMTPATEPMATEKSDSSSLPLAIGRHHWAIATSESVIESSELELLSPLLKQVEYFEQAKFFFVNGKFLDPDRRLWESEVGFSGLARSRQGRWLSLSGDLTLVWADHSQEVGEEVDLRWRLSRGDWRIEAWRLNRLQSHSSETKLFREVLDELLPDDKELARARTSLHAHAVLQSATQPDFQPPYDHFYHIAFDRHPGVSVVDLNQDGYDDLYLMDRIGRNQFFVNQGDGTFTEIAAQLGLDVEGHSSCALFADFDNDGDSDLLLGRTLARSQYLVNESGRFVDRSEKLSGVTLPYLVSSLSAADYDRDGLLDIYISTYAGYMIEQALESGSATDDLLLGEFLPRNQAEELFRRSAGNEMYTRRVGPPNMLLHNTGDSFELSPASKKLEVWRNTYQATWCDANGDLLPDLYLANDFSPNTLFLNQGGGEFSDATETAGVADIGFGMGVSWGDYDNDGQQDLYVSNMYSKAGRRITGALEGLVDESFARMAGGNTLFRRDGPKYQRASGVKPPSLLVEKAGWSWGAQFVDVDNNGYLDIYALSGYYTAPPQIDVEIDL